jgi:hypothetical protein
MKKWLLPLALIAAPVFLPATLSVNSAYAAEQPGALGDLTPFEAIAHDTLVLVDKGEMKAAKKRITDFETAWDKAEKTLYPKSKAEWSVIDDAADAAISALRARKLNPVDAQKTVSALIDTLKHPVAE